MEEIRTLENDGLNLILDESFLYIRSKKTSINTTYVMKKSSPIGLSFKKMAKQNALESQKIFFNPRFL